jgi:hypothetical protein
MKGAPGEYAIGIQDTSQQKASMWKWVTVAEGHGYLRGSRLYDVGITADGTLHNPNGYPEEAVRAAIEGALERKHERRSEAAKKAADTRARRKEREVSKIVAQIKAGGALTPAGSCRLCGKALDDPESIGRGIGSDCWQFVLTVIEGSAA